MSDETGSADIVSPISVPTAHDALLHSLGLSLHLPLPLQNAQRQDVAVILLPIAHNPSVHAVFEPREQPLILATRTLTRRRSCPRRTCRGHRRPAPRRGWGPWGAWSRSRRPTGYGPRSSRTTVGGTASETRNIFNNPLLPPLWAGARGGENARERRGWRSWGG